MAFREVDKGLIVDLDLLFGASFRTGAAEEKHVNSSILIRVFPR